MNYHIRRHRVEIQKKVERRNTVGEVLFGFERVCEVWAEIHSDKLITTRYFGPCFPGWRIKVADDVLEIVGVIDRPGNTRLVELQTESLTKTSPRWLRPRDQADEQQTLLGLSASVRRTQATRI